MGIADKVHLCRKHGLTRRLIQVKVFQTWGKNEAIKYLNEYIVLLTQRTVENL